MSLPRKPGAFLPNYVNSLVGHDLERYKNKIVMCCNQDPYEITTSSASEDVNLWPSVSYFDIVNYLVYSTSCYTLEQLKAFKSMDAHNFFTSGWVHPPIVFVLPDSNIIVLGKVNHSQSLREPPLRNWILAKQCGEIITAHCNCMAGRGEVCSHVGAVLFAIEYGVKLRESTTCTGKANQWLPPTLKSVPYLTLEEIDFSSKNTKKRKLDATVEEGGIVAHATNNPPKKITKPLPSVKIKSFLREIFDVTQDVALFRVLPEFCDKLRAAPRPQLPVTLPKLLYDSNLTKLSYADLRIKCEEIFPTITIDVETATVIESNTVKQATSKEWFLQRAGRITASNMKSVCRTDHTNPSVSLIKTICYPDNTFHSAATEWGSTHEKDALKRYENEMSKTHVDIHVSQCGFCISSDFPFIGASPDGKVECICCGEGLIEVKCPYSFKDGTIDNLVQSKKSCLVFNDDGQITLDKTHSYFYQVQTQLAVCKSEFCDFVVWTQEDCFIERILPSEEIRTEIVEMATHFFKSAVLPELVAKFFTSKKDTVLEPNLPVHQRGNTVCYCKDFERDPMLICLNPSCEFKKFHWECLKIKVKPRTKQWYCPDCKKLQPNKQKVKTSQPKATYNTSHRRGQTAR